MKISLMENIIGKDGDVFETKEERIYNADGSLEKIKKFGNNTSEVLTEYTYFPIGEIETEVVSTSGISALTTAYEYDSTNRYLWRKTAPDGLTTETNIYYTGRLLGTITGLGLTTDFSYDTWGNIIEVTDYLGKKTFINKS